MPVVALLPTAVLLLPLKATGGGDEGETTGGKKLLVQSETRRLLLPSGAAITVVAAAVAADDERDGSGVAGLRCDDKISRRRLRASEGLLSTGSGSGRETTVVAIVNAIDKKWMDQKQTKEIALLSRENEDCESNGSINSYWTGSIGWFVMGGWIGLLYLYGKVLLLESLEVEIFFVIQPLLAYRWHAYVLGVKNTSEPGFEL